MENLVCDDKFVRLAAANLNLESILCLIVHFAHVRSAAADLKLKSILWRIFHLALCVAVFCASSSYGAFY